MVSRHVKILTISQGHLAPGMNLIKWRNILAKYQVRDLKKLSNPTLDQIIIDIEQESHHETQDIQDESNLYVLQPTLQNGMVVPAGPDTRLLPGLLD